MKANQPMINKALHRVFLEFKLIKYLVFDIDVYHVSIHASVYVSILFADFALSFFVQNLLIAGAHKHT